jgi:hypothetical protein
MLALLSLHCEIIFILLYPSIIKRIKEMEGRKYGYRNALFCFIVKQGHKSELRIYQKRLKKVPSLFVGTLL